MLSKPGQISKPKKEVEGNPLCFDDKIYAKLPIRGELSKELPFPNLGSRNVIAIVLAFYGDRSEVWQLMQHLSHVSRSYISSQNGLKGFVNSGPSGYLCRLRALKEAGELDSIVTHQNLDLDAFESDLKTRRQVVDREMYIRDRAPQVYIYLLKSFSGQQQKLQEYMDYCKSFRDDPRKYSLYVHGYLLEWFEQQRREGKLEKVKFFGLLMGRCLVEKVIRMDDDYNNKLVSYVGEVDENGRMCGFGSAQSKNRRFFKETYVGTFLNNTFEGICVQRDYECEGEGQGEMRDGYWFGKATHYVVEDINNNARLSPKNNMISKFTGTGSEGRGPIIVNWWYENGKANANVFEYDFKIGF